MAAMVDDPIPTGEEAAVPDPFFAVLDRNLVRIRVLLRRAVAGPSWTGPDEEGLIIAVALRAWTESRTGPPGDEEALARSLTGFAKDAIRDPVRWAPVEGRELMRVFAPSDPAASEALSAAIQGIIGSIFAPGLQDEIRRVEDSLSALPAAERQAAELGWIEDRPVSEVARALGRSEAEARALVDLVLARLAAVPG